MSTETMEWLNTQTLIGFTEKRGTAWHHRAELQGDEPNHYEGAIPIEDVRRRLFDWQALELPIEYTMPNGEKRQAEGRKVIVRSDTGAALGTFKSTYTPHQYDEWLIRNVEAILDADLSVGSAGLLKGGGVAWVQIEMEETMEVAGVEYRPFLTAATSFDGTLATTYVTGAQVVVCDNTLSTALSGIESARFKVRHSAQSMGRLTDAREALEVVHSVSDTFAAQVEALTNEVVSEASWNRFLKAYTGLDQELTKAAETRALAKSAALEFMYLHDDRVAPWTGTAYGVLAAVNTFAQHERPIRVGTREGRNAFDRINGNIDKLDAGTLALLARV